ncbi:MAG TPA: hypothetical protein PKL65_00560 [Bacteroidales bacterium]|jgi:hypothetical protein|nr:hypothetical protein [Bacteroidales bacterium]HNR40696.1 hypothetical protein [Bacteroidales bacterium]HPM17744.1 hypothetical protein [Bacteroidales bacterium]HQG77780.1 hypothetical protein [Bacteroidales bacterium]
MKTAKKILMLLITISVTSFLLNGQAVRVHQDTAVMVRQEGQTQEQTGAAERPGRQNQTWSQNHAGQDGRAGNRTKVSAGNSGGSQPREANAGEVKKIRGARPDWSRARGARPASVERPSGSRIPKGAGKPGGAKGPGRR